jgi:hypothetical protein
MVCVILGKKSFRFLSSNKYLSVMEMHWNLIDVETHLLKYTWGLFHSSED